MNYLTKYINKWIFIGGHYENRPRDRERFELDLVSASGQNDPDMGPSAVWDKMVASKRRKFVEIESIHRFPPASASPTDAEKLL